MPSSRCEDFVRSSLIAKRRPYPPFDGGGGEARRRHILNSNNRVVAH